MLKRSRSFAASGAAYLLAIGLVVSGLGFSFESARASDAQWVPNMSFSPDGNLVDFLMPIDGQLYATGSFIGVGGNPINHIARWDGSAWHPIAPIAFTEMALIHTVLKDGNNLYVAGMFGEVGGISTMHIAMWDGTVWHSLEGGTNRAVRALLKGPDGIYVGGEFSTAGSIAARGIARWDGQQWHTVGSGTNQINNHVASLAFVNGDLYAGGAFNIVTAPGESINKVARWDGSMWQPLGNARSNGVSGQVTTLASRGPYLYVGGIFATAGGKQARCIARWDGNAWSAIGGGITGPGQAAVRYILPLANGEIYAGGFFNMADGQTANNIAHWKAGQWHPLGSGTSTYGADQGSVKSLAIMGDVLYVGGKFDMAGGKDSPRFAEWHMSPVVPVYFDGFEAVSRGDRVDLSWTVRWDEPLLGYRIYRRDEGTSVETPIHDGLIDLAARSFVDYTVKGGASYEYALAAIKADGSEARSPLALVDVAKFGLALSQNSPNPFNPTTNIRFVLTEAQQVTLEVFNLKGQLVASLLDEGRPAGTNSVVWDGRDNGGSLVGSGVYFYRLTTPDGAATKKMTLLK